jgi:hypothetical protein
MRHRTLFRGLLTLACLAAAPGLSPGSRLSAAPLELKKVRILLVFDTYSDLASTLEIDEERVTHTLLKGIPAARRDEPVVLKGKAVTRERILAYYRDLKTGPDEALLFFYGGHGATDDAQGHYFQLQGGKGKPLVRAELRKAMEAKKAGLVLLLTDCCSTRIKMPKVVRTKGGLQLPPVLHPTFRALFFRARGTVDVTAATGNASWCDEKEGGIFTRSLCRMLLTRPERLTPAKALTWHEFFPLLQKDTEALFGVWSKEMKGRGEKIDASTQKPQAFLLGQAPGVFAVVGIGNKTAEPLHYRYRWSNDRDQGWKEMTLKPGARHCHAQPLGPGQAGAVLEAQFDGIRKVQKLSAKRWAGVGQPTFADAAHYNIKANP